MEGERSDQIGGANAPPNMMRLSQIRSLGLARWPDPRARGFRLSDLPLSFDGVPVWVPVSI